MCPVTCIASSDRLDKFCGGLPALWPFRLRPLWADVPYRTLSQLWMACSLLGAHGADDNIVLLLKGSIPRRG